MVGKETVHVDESRSPKMYSPLIDRQALARQETSSLLKRVFHNKPTMLMSNMVDEGNITNEDLDEMIRMLQKAKEERS